MTKQILISLTLTPIFIIPQTSIAQYDIAMETLFLARQPNARAEAMGKGYVAIDGDFYASLYNPAGIGSIKNISLSLTYIPAPYYLLHDATSIFIGTCMPVKKLGVIGFNWYRFDFGEAYTSDKFGKIKDEYHPHESSFTLSWSRTLFKNLYVGINAKIAQEHLGPKNFKYNQNVFLADMGLFKSFEFSPHTKIRHRIGLGVSLFNFTNSKLKIGQFKEAIPSIFRTALSYTFAFHDSTLSRELSTFKLLIHLEYQDLTNSRYGGGFKVGTEITLFNILSVRYGGFKQKLNDYGYPQSNKSVLEDQTFGFGVLLPICLLSNGRIPVVMVFDMVNMRQPSYIKNYDKWDRFLIYSICFKYNF